MNRTCITMLPSLLIVAVQSLAQVTSLELGPCNSTHMTTSIFPVSDATTPTLGANLTGGGGNLVGVYCNGSSWAIVVGSAAKLPWANVSGPPNFALAVTRTATAVTRGLNTCFQSSATLDTIASYYVEIAATINLTGSQTGTVTLETFTDSGCTTGTVELGRAVNGNSGTIVLGLALTQTYIGALSGVIPAGRWAKIRTANTTGTPTFTARPGQEFTF